MILQLEAEAPTEAGLITMVTKQAAPTNRQASVHGTRNDNNKKNKLNLHSDWWKQGSEQTENSWEAEKQSVAAASVYSLTCFKFTSNSCSASQLMFELKWSKWEIQSQKKSSLTEKSEAEVWLGNFWLISKLIRIQQSCSSCLNVFK